MTYKELIDKPYNENFYRVPVGLGACTAIIFLFVYGVIYVMYACDKGRVSKKIGAILVIAPIRLGRIQDSPLH